MLLAATVSVAVVFFLIVTLAGCVVIAGTASTVIVAEPLAVPAQYASPIEVTEYVVAVPGDTVRVAVVPDDNCCVTPSDQVTDTG